MKHGSKTPSQTPVITAQQSADLPIALNTTRRNLLRAGIGATFAAHRRQPVAGGLQQQQRR